MKRLFLLFFLVSLISSGHAQDERLYRKTVLGAFVPQEQKEKIPTKYLFKANSDMYRVDISGNGYKEGIVFEKIDGENWLHIHDSHLMRIRSFPLHAEGVGAHPIKVSVRQMSKHVRILYISFYEGYTKGLDFHGSSRAYIINVRDGNIKKATLSKGPRFFEESEEIFGRYYLKRMKVSVEDLDGNGTKELVFRKHRMVRIYLLNKEDHWVRPKSKFY